MLANSWTFDDGRQSKKYDSFFFDLLGWAAKDVLADLLTKR